MLTYLCISLHAMVGLTKGTNYNYILPSCRGSFGYFLSFRVNKVVCHPTRLYFMSSQLLRWVATPTKPIPFSRVGSYLNHSEATLFSSQDETFPGFAVAFVGIDAHISLHFVACNGRSDEGNKLQWHTAILPREFWVFLVV